MSIIGLRFNIGMDWVVMTAQRLTNYVVAYIKKWKEINGLQ